MSRLRPDVIVSASAILLGIEYFGSSAGNGSLMEAQAWMTIGEGWKFLATSDVNPGEATGSFVCLITFRTIVEACGV